MKYRPIPPGIFRTHWATHTAAEISELGQLEFYVLQFLRTYAGADERFGPIRDAELLDYAGDLTLRSFWRAREILKAKGFIIVARKYNGMIYSFPARAADREILEKVRAAEQQLGAGAPDCLVQMAVASIKPAIKKARRKLAKERMENARLA